MNTPRVFLSYTRVDLPVVQQLEQGLTANGVSVWRDQEKIRGGQKWPKVLGEAIATQDYFLLAWSKNARDSHFVEFEWCTAVALKKTIIPCMLDDTPLPPSLTADQNVDAKEPTKAVAAVLQALQISPSQAAPQHTRAVIEQLASIKAIKEKEVTRAAKTIFGEHNWIVQGDVHQYQAARDINITNPPSSKAEKTWLEKWGLAAGLAVSVLTVLTLVPQVRKEWVSVFWPSDGQTVEHHLGGFIQDDQSNQYLVDVKVTVTSSEFSKSVKTNEQGYFIFRDIPGHQNKKLIMKAEKEGYHHVEEDVELGDSKMRFAMKRVSQ
jgi:hypothetical protein